LKVIDTKRACCKEIGCRSCHVPVGLSVRFGCKSSKSRKQKEEEEKTAIKWSEIDDLSTEVRCQAKLDELPAVVKDGENTQDSESLSEALARAGKATRKVKQVAKQDSSR
jgi:hypothetical protein